MPPNVNNLYNTYKGVRYLNYDIPDDQDRKQSVQGFINFFHNHGSEVKLRMAFKKLSLQKGQQYKFLKNPIDLTQVPSSQSIIQSYAAQLENSLQQLQASRSSGLMNKIEQNLWQVIDSNGKAMELSTNDMNAAKHELENLKNLISAIQGLDKFVRSANGAIANITAWQNIRSRFLTKNDTLRAFAQRIVDGMENGAISKSYLKNPKQLLSDLKVANFAAKSTGSAVLGKTAKGKERFEVSIGKFNEDLVNLIANTGSAITGKKLTDAIKAALGSDKGRTTRSTSIGGGLAIDTTIRGSVDSVNWKMPPGNPLTDVLGNIKVMEDGLKISFNDNIYIPENLGISVKRYNLNNPNGISLGELGLGRFQDILLSIVHEAKGRIYLYRAIGADRQEVANYVVSKKAEEIVFGNTVVGGPDFVGLIVINGKMMNMVDFIQLCLQNNGVKTSISGLGGVPNSTAWWPYNNVPRYIDKIHASKIKIATAAAAGSLYRQI